MEIFDFEFPNSYFSEFRKIVQDNWGQVFFGVLAKMYRTSSSGMKNVIVKGPVHGRVFHTAPQTCYCRQSCHIKQKFLS